MVVSNVFITGMQKCGTTALSEWMVTSGLAEDRVPDLKEPFLYANDDPHPVRLRTSDLPLLDSSVGYADNPAAIRRMPEYDTRLILCVRNQFDRAWSAYKMLKLVTIDTEEVRSYWSSCGAGVEERRTFDAKADVLEVMHSTNMKHFPRRSHGFIERYGNQELEHIRTHDFAARIEYELAFYLSRRSWPLFSVVAGSMFYFPIRNMLEKYQPADVSVISVHKLQDPALRRSFVQGVFDKDLDTPGIPFVFSSAEIGIDEAKPDFMGKVFDLLRACFRYDLEQARGLIATTRFGDSLLDNAELDRYLEAR
jgi:hypothetical protein